MDMLVPKPNTSLSIVKCRLKLDNVMQEMQLRRMKRKDQERNIDWYSWLISQHPFLVLFLCVCLISTCTTVSIVFVDLPDFTEPSKGFEVRGTELTNRLNTWKNILSNTGFNSTFSVYPYVYAKQRAIYQSLKTNQIIKDNKTNLQQGNKTRFKRSLEPYKWNFTKNGYFCINPRSSYAQIVFEAKLAKDSLWSSAYLLEICQLEKLLLKHQTYADVCSRQDITTCCPTLSLPNYVAYLNNIAECEDITQMDVDKTSNILSKCVKFYLLKNLTANCWDPKSNATSNCNDIPYECVKYNAVYSIFHYLVDKRFTSSFYTSQNQSNLKHHLRYTSVFLPTPKGRHLKQIYYSNFQSIDSSKHSLVKVTSIDFGLKDLVFEDYLFTDKIYPIFAFCIVAIFVCLFTRSIFITLMGIISSASALIIAYFLYAVILDFAFFPFMNLMAVIVIVGIGADYIFVYCSAWRSVLYEDCKNSCVSRKRPLPQRLGVITKKTLSHATRSMFVTSVTTASAFLSNFSSSVTAVKCFSVYASLTVIALFILSATWLPATFVIYESYFRSVKIHFKNCHCLQCRKIFVNIFTIFRDWFNVFFYKIQLILIFQYKIIWLLLCPCLAGCGFFLIFVSPKLQLPSSNEHFQYFKSNHLFESYFLNHHDKFPFGDEQTAFMPVTVIFGVLPTDTGSHFDPNDKGRLIYSENFNVSSPRSQLWLRNFCNDVRNQSFVKPATQNSFEAYRMCFIDPFIGWMDSRECFADSVDVTPCCRDSTFPYQSGVFELCLKQAVVQLSQSPTVRLYDNTPGPRFDANDSIRAIILEFPSIYKHTEGHAEVDQFYKSVDAWMKDKMESAPQGLTDGWFVSELEFYALQNGLYHGTLLSIALSVAVVFGAMLLMTQNIIITLLSNLSVTFTIFVTVGILVLLRWELNILESVTISIAIGLSVDFTVHYGVAYLVAPAKERLSRVEYSCINMGPAITLAAITTFIAGLCMLPANVVVYYKFGVFLMVIMSISWFYGTYFFLSTCAIWGPEGHKGDISQLFKYKKNENKQQSKNNVIYLKGSQRCEDVIEVSLSEE